MAARQQLRLAKDPGSAVIAELAARWRETAAMLRKYGDARGAELVELLAGEAEAALRGIGTAPAPPAKDAERGRGCRGGFSTTSGAQACGILSGPVSPSAWPWRCQAISPGLYSTGSISWRSETWARQSRSSRCFTHNRPLAPYCHSWLLRSHRRAARAGQRWEVRAQTVLVQREMESGRSPSVSIPQHLAQVSGLIWPKGVSSKERNFAFRKATEAGP
jgi:hypothetical protein